MTAADVLTSTEHSLSHDEVAQLFSSAAADHRLLSTSNAVVRVGLDDVALDHSVVTSMSHEVSNRLDDWSVTNQKQSGRCWLFAALNLMRAGARERLGLKQFEFSQNYAMFFDKLERANYFFGSILETSDLPVDDRLVAFLLDNVLDDGGQWDMAVSVFLKHGVVPKAVMPETKSSSHTAKMNVTLRSIVREGAWRLRSAVAAGAPGAELEEIRREFVQRVFRTLVVHLGLPPVDFEWQWRDDDGGFHRDGTVTPQQFLARYVTVDLTRYVCLVDDPSPEHGKGEVLTVSHLGNVVGGRPVRYLNVDIATAKDLAMRTLLDGEPVWFGCDTDPHSHRKLALWHEKLFDLESVYGVRFGMDKEARVRYHDSAMTHAMVFTGVDVDGDRPRAWRVENSWGKKNAAGGFHTMSDSWFDEYVFEVVIARDRLSPELQRALDAEPRVLPAWDPMGALA